MAVQISKKRKVSVWARGWGTLATQGPRLSRGVTERPTARCLVPGSGYGRLALPRAADGGGLRERPAAAERSVMGEDTDSASSRLSWAPHIPGRSSL